MTQEIKLFKVQLFSYGKGKFRLVEVPTSELTDDLITNLELVYKYGQNVYQTQELPSVSTGDVISFPDLTGYPVRYIVSNIGFAKLKNETYTIMKHCLTKSIVYKSSPKTTYQHLLWEAFGNESFKYC